MRGSKRPRGQKRRQRAGQSVPGRDAMKVSVALLLVALTGSQARVRKRWLPNWDLNTKTNWQGKQLPCAGRVATLPRYPENSLFLGADLTLGSLALPFEGEVILGDKARLMFDPTSSGDCTDAKWTRHGQDQWWDPEAWSYPGFEDPASSPVPHLHRVPCTRDTALFPATNDSLFTVHLTPPPVSIASLSIGNRNYTTSEFAAYTRTPEGTLRFQGVSSTSDNAPLYVESPGECRDLTGCMCGSEPAASVICRIMSAKCGIPRCDKPIDMTGFCCPVCGAEVTINHGGTVPLETLRTLLHNHLQTPDMKDIRGHLAKMSDQKYHVYFTAANPHGNFKAASELFKARFNRELNLENSHEVLLSYSGYMKQPVSGRVAPQHVAVTLVTLTICLMIGAAVYYLRKRRITTSLSYMFRRLESNSRRVSVVSDVIGGRRPSNASSVFAYSRESGLRFLNPIFNQSMASLAGAGASSVINEVADELPEKQADGEHENPMYTAFQNMNPEEQQASEEAIKEREKILEAAGNLVASSLRSREKRMSGQAENNLASITEERDTKEVMSGEGGGVQDAGSDAPKATHTSTVSNKNEDFSQDCSAVQNDVDEINEHVDPKAENGETSEDIIADQPSHGVDETQTIIDIGHDPSVSSGHVDHQEPSSSSSSSSSDDDDANNALKNLEGFTPLVDLKFEK